MRKPLTLSMLAAAFVFGVFALTPGTASAAAAGDLIKLADDGNPDTTADSAVYFYGADNKRYVFPNSQTYFTWYADFSLVKIVTSAELAALPIGGNVTYRPGTRLVKITSDPNVYAVEPGGLLRHVQSEVIAKALYGDNWSKRVDDVPDAFFFNYASGSPLAAAVYPDGSIVKRTTDNVYFRIENRNKRKISSADVLAGLRVQAAHVLETAASLDDYPNASDITVAEANITDTSQKTTAAFPTTPTFSVRNPPTNYIAIGGEATLLEIHLATAKAMTIKSLTVRIDATTNNPTDATTDDDKGGLVYLNNAQQNFKGARFVDAAGAEPFGRKDFALDLSKDQSQTLAFAGSVSVPANTDRVLYLRVNVNTFIPAGEGFKATLVTSGTQIVDGLTGAVTPFAPTADITGPTLATLNASLEVLKSATPGNKTYVRGTKDAEISGLTFQATTVAPNVIKAITLQGYVDDEGAAGFLPGADADDGREARVRELVPSISLWTTGTGAAKVAGPSFVDIDGRVKFDGLNVAIPAGQSVILVARGDVSSTYDTEGNPKRVTFDITNASQDMSVVDDKGAKVNAIGLLPNGGSGAIYSSTIKKNGTITWTFVGNVAPAVAGAETLLGTLSADAKDDAFTLRSFTIRQQMAVAKSLLDIRVEYPTGVAGATASVTKPFLAGVVVVGDLNVPLDKDKKTDIKIYGKVLPRDGGAVYGESLKILLGMTDPFTFVAKSDGTLFNESNLVTQYGDFTVPTNSASNCTVRFSTLTVAKAANNPTGIIYRDTAVEVLRFTVKAGDAGAVRLGKLSFKLGAGDVGIGGANDDALEKWADANGDFEDDDFIGNLKVVVGTTKSPPLGEESSGRVRYSIVKGGVKNTSPSSLTSAAGDYAILEYDMTGNEYTIAAGATFTFAFELDTTKFGVGKDWNADASLLSAEDFVWTDVSSGTYPALSGNDTVGGINNVANSITVKT
jgi:hypothetical protein